MPPAASCSTVQSALDLAGGQMKTLTDERDAEKDRASAAPARSPRSPERLGSGAADADALNKQLQSQTQKARSANERLALLSRAQQTLTADKRTAEEQIAALQSLLSEKTAASKGAMSRVDALTAKLADEQARTAKLEEDAERFAPN